MERLTYYDKLGIARYKDKDGGIIYSFEPIRRLAAYEDSGLTPDEVMERSKIAQCKNCVSARMEHGYIWCLQWDAEVIENGFCYNGIERHKNENRNPEN